METKKNLKSLFLHVKVLQSYKGYKVHTQKGIIVSAFEVPQMPRLQVQAFLAIYKNIPMKPICVVLAQWHVWHTSNKQ